VTSEAARTRRALLSWYRRRRRDLPWRRTDDPYAIWISETMLQQTRVETVIPYYERFLGRFPDVRVLAEASPDAVMEHWAGLGYYRRARMLHEAARVVVREHAGRLPDTAEGLRALPGVGRYTAGAVASIAFGRREPVLDGNVIRVLARLHDLREDVKSAPVQRRLWEEAASLAAGPSPGDLNQALMELGATLCTPRAPRCEACPLRRVCRAHAAGDPESLPVKGPRRAPRPVRGVAAWVERGGRVLAVRRPPEGLLGGLWELPGADLAPEEDPERGVARALRERLGLEVEEARALGRVRHVFSHRLLDLVVLRARVAPGRVRRRGFDAHRFCSRRALRALPLSTVARKAIDLAAEA
jgi:A/G-specific adenine glycosylase